MNKGVLGILTDGAFTPFDGFKTRLALMTNGAFTPFVVVGEEIIHVGIGTKVRPVTIKRELRWNPKQEQIKLIFSVWEKSSEAREYWFEIWNRKYDYVDVLLEIIEKKFGSVSLLFDVYDIKILENKMSDIEIIGLSENGSIFEGKDFGWSVVDDK